MPVGARPFGYGSQLLSLTESDESGRLKTTILSRLSPADLRVKDMVNAGWV